MTHLAASWIVCGLAVAAQAANPEAGRTNSLGCQACHGSTGIGTAGDIPNLAGQKAGYLQTQLNAFRTHERKHELMNAIAEQLSDDDIANLAAYWSSLPAAGATDTHGADSAAAMRRSRMTFPAAFPQDFVMYSEKIDAADDSAKRSWANRVALTAAMARRPLPAGSAIVVEHLSAKSVVPGAVNSYAAMESRDGWGDDVPELLRNGDWSYGLFDGQKTLRADFNYARCLVCHKPQADSSYVFGLEALRK